MKTLIVSFFLAIFTSGVAKAQEGAKIYGGKHYDQFLGCLDCDGETPDSIWSPFTEYGSTHNPKSIWNEKGLYGSVTSNFSPYNPKAKFPPRMIGRNGKCIGYLTINKNSPNLLLGSVADLICFGRDMVLRDGVEKYAEQFEKVN